MSHGRNSPSTFFVPLQSQAFFFSLLENGSTFFSCCVACKGGCECVRTSVVDNYGHLTLSVHLKCGKVVLFFA